MLEVSINLNSFWTEQFYLAVDAELSKVGLTVEKFRLKRKGELEEDFVILQADPFRQKQSRDEF
jgi:hypothetical protein